MWKTSAARARRAIGAALLAGCAPAAAAAVDCADRRFEGVRHTVCTVDPAQEDLRLFLRDGAGRPWGQFDRLDSALRADGRTLAFAMNGGMYHPDRRPVGLYIEDGQKQMRAIATPGPGNFGLLPNGVFCIGDGRARVIETRTYLERRPDCRHATQSGPMLVINGALHPRFLPDSTSRFRRNGVGVRPDGRVVFAISGSAVTFHHFARLFRDALGAPQALYLDGNVSRLWAPAIGRADPGRPMGPIVGVTKPSGG